MTNIKAQMTKLFVLEFDIRKSDIVKLWPFIIFTLALAVRFIFLEQFRHNPFFYSDVAGLDTNLYHRWAGSLAAGWWPGEKLLYGHPFYPYIVSFIYRFWAVEVYSVIVFQFLLGSLSCVLIYFIAKRIFSAGAGIIASFIAAFYGPFLFYEGCLLPNAPAIFLNLSAVFVLGQKGVRRFFDKKAPDPFFVDVYRTFLGGLLLGCSLLTNSAAAGFIIILTFWLFLKFRAQKKIFFTRAACLLIGIILPLMFLSLKHFACEGRLDSFGAHGGINFYIGNNPDAEGVFRPPFGFTPSAEGLSQDSSEYARKASGKPLSAAGVSAFWYRKAFGFIREHPVLWLKLLFRKFLLFWNGLEIGDVIDYYFLKNYSPFLRFNPLIFGVIAPLGLLGIVLALRRFRRAFILYAGAAGFMLPCVLFFVNSRYRLSAVPFIIIFAGFAVFKIWEKFKSKAFARLAGYIVVLAVFFLFCSIKLISADRFTPLYNLSVVYAEKGHCRPAIKILKALLKGKKNLPSLHFNLGVCYYKEGLTEDAIYEFKEVLRLNPDDYNSHFNLGIIYYENKDYEKAREEFTRALEINDKDPSIGYWMERVGRGDKSP